MSGRSGEARAGSARSAPGRASAAVLAVALLGATVAAYLPTLGADFLTYDDPKYVTENPLVRGGLDAGHLARAFTTFHDANWIPLVWVSLMLDHAVHGLDPRGYHATNLLLHALSTLLLFAALRRLTGAAGRSAFVAGLFALHPLHVESVAWIAERKDVLSGVFWMGTLLGYAYHVERPTPVRYLGVAAPFAAGLLCKATGVTLPFVLLLLDHWPADRLRDADGRIRAGRALRLGAEKLPLLVLAAGAAALTWAAQRGGGAVVAGPLGFGERIANAVLAYGAYLRKTVWPSDLSFYYPHPAFTGSGLDPTSPEVVLVALGLVAATVAAFALARRRHAWSPVLVGWLWFLGTLVPMLGLVQVGGQAMADRYTYVPLVGLGIAAAWGAWEAVRPAGARRAVAVAAAAALVAFGVATHVQAGYWRDSERLYRRALALDPDNYKAHYELARWLNAEGRHAEAERHAREALRPFPEWSDAYLNLGVALEGQGRHDEAIRALYRAVSRSDTLEGRLLLARSLISAGRHDPARSQLRRVVEAHPGHLPARLALAGVAEARGDRQAALRHYERLHAMAPGTAEGRQAARRLVGLVSDWPAAPPEAVARAAELAETLAREAPEAFEATAERLRARTTGAGS